MKIIEMLAPIIANGARSGLKRTGFRGATIHNTGNAAVGAGAKNHGTYLQNSGKTKQASWHYAVDENYAVNSIPENEIAWHAGDGGSGDGNCKTIAIEICMNPDGDLLKATDNAAELTADILKRNGVTKAVSGVNLFQHNHWSGKNCPQMIRAGKPYNWDTFVAKVNAHLGATPKPVTPVTPTTKYSKGQTVTINGVYTSSTSTQKLVPLVTSGKITDVVPTAPNPYLLNNGDIGWVNDGCIVTKTATVSKPQTSSEFKVGDKVRVTSRTDYNGIVNFAWVLDVIFTVLEEPKGNRVVIGRNGQVTGAWAKSNLRKV